MPPSLLSIGAVSKACDVPVETLRTWERRYGFPVATRTAGGQRLYQPATVELLLEAKRSIDQGQRPAQAFEQIVAASGAAAPAKVGRPLPTVVCDAAPCGESDAETDEMVSRWLRAASLFDAATLAQGFETEWHRLGLFDFLERRIHPFIVAIGEAWLRDEIGIPHEHFASDRVIDFLGTIWRPLSDAATGPVLIGATMPMEHHACRRRLQDCLPRARHTRGGDCAGGASGRCLGLHQCLCDDAASACARAAQGAPPPPCLTEPDRGGRRRRAAGD